MTVSTGSTVKGRLRLARVLDHLTLNVTLLLHVLHSERAQFQAPTLEILTN
jgi:hypothetical protein